MRFWDSSAIVPLVCREPESPRCRAWLREDRVVLVWALAAAEVVSALARRRRKGALAGARFAEAKRRLGMLEAAWSEVSAWDPVRIRARRLLEVHALTAADALHLGAALVVVEERTAGIGFVTFDRHLAAAADREGFEVLGASGGHAAG